MDWVQGFYSKTGSWWGKAEAEITEQDHRRVRLLSEHVGDGRKRVLELGSGYGATAAATARSGHVVTAVEVSDRADFASRFSHDVQPGSLAVVRADFYEVHLPTMFDVVCYWDGFGVGSDTDQRRLLARIADEWLQPGGVALVDVYNPLVWARWDGDEEHRSPDAGAGYDYELRERTSFDPVTCTAIDTWWEVSRPERKISQFLRCYSPADLSLLLAGTGLVLKEIHIGEHAHAPANHPASRELLHKQHKYLAVLHHDTDD
jgi:SAM-dependent methyltransferase